jgi:hypothetical protein
MEDFYLNPSTRLKIELAKADALRQVRPALQEPHRRGSSESIRAYLARVVGAHLHCLIESQVLPPNLDMEAFTNRAIEDAKKHAHHPAVDRVAGENFMQLVDISRVGYLMELNRRMQEWELCPIHSVVDYDPDEEEKIRAEWKAIRAARESEKLGSQLRPQATDDAPKQVREPPATDAGADLAEAADPVETCRSGTAFQNAEAASPGKGRKGDVSLIEGSDSERKDVEPNLDSLSGIPDLVRPRRTPDLESSRKRLALVGALARELATIKQDVERFCTAEDLKQKHPQFILWEHIDKAELKELAEGAAFTPKAYAENLTLRKFGITSRETLKKDRKKLRRALKAKRP